MKVPTITAIVLALACLDLAGCHYEEEEKKHEEGHEIVVTSPVQKDVVSTEQYVCQIHSRRHIEVRALEGGYLEAIPVKEGQAVNQGELMFKIVPTLFQAKLDAEVAEAQLANIELSNTQTLFKKGVVSDKEVALAQAKLAKAQAEVNLARAELNFTELKAPFDGIIDRLYEQQGSLIEEGDILTTLSDNSVMWVYFNVPESRYLEYKANMDAAKANREAGSEEPDTDDGDKADDDKADEDDKADDDQADAVADKAEKDKAADGNDVEQDGLTLELVLANGNTFPQPGKISAIEADFNNETGNIAFRADFANPSSLLRHGQTGTVLIHRAVHDAIVIPQRATFDILAKHYVFVVGEDGVVHQRDITIGETLEDIYLITEGLSVNDKIVLEGVLQVRDGEKVEFEFRDPNEVLGDLKYKAE
jgi:membrane fusion protein (multidrug efflux system)